jgi:hybrid cluster-associated redox disulfide protein
MQPICDESRKRSLTYRNQRVESLHSQKTLNCLRQDNERLRWPCTTGSMKKIALPSTEMTVDSVMHRWPSTIRVFLDFGMHCVGCPIATFHSVDEACTEHGIDLENFLERLRAAVQTAQVPLPGEAACGCPSASPNSA